MPTPETTNPVAERETNERGLKRNGREEEDLRKSRQEIDQATAKTEEAIEQIVPAWINASRTFVPPALYNPGQAINALFDAQQQILTLQRKFWSELLTQSQDAMKQMDDQRRDYSRR